MNRLILKRISRALWVAIVIVLFILVVYWLFPLMYPFLLAWLVAYVMNPLVLFLQKKAKLPHWLAVTLSLFVYLGAILLVLSAAVTRLVKELIKLTKTFDIHIENFKNLFVAWTQSDVIQNIVLEINKFIRENPDYQQTINNNIDKTTQSVSSAVTDLVNRFFNGILNFLTALPNMGAVLMVIVLAAFFISKNWERHGRTFSGLVPVNLRKPMADIWRDLRKALFGYLQAQFIMISITTVIVIIGLIILRVDSAFTIGLVIGLVDLLPYLGVGIIMIPWALYAFMSDDLTLGIGLSILYTIILIARQITEPKVLASSVGLDPLATLIGMFVGLKLFGVLGLIIGPVSLVVLDAFNRANVLRDLRNYILAGRIR
ncbi:sporulation integral membrane protein YtvI [Paenibacillus sp. P96]|uniref:Sporulation integral membrane protein YtvI n=1 Tax=Paenibacillus zeirhizosphaerae TaxID=2987519 RepID=A0ABT9FT12_9BACL|nr:sporulation integral membrane protein YtvI [Paenibacillus sp. P96]MDP4097877.1 sporulation integral membrane protein YtvI [Paenibacillus sp. P96]